MPPQNKSPFFAIKFTGKCACLYFRSQSIAAVSIHVSATPKKISLLNRNTEVVLHICFSATFRPAHRTNQVGKYFYSLVLHDYIFQKKRVLLVGAR